MSANGVTEGHEAAVLAMLAKHAARIAGVEKVVVFLRAEPAGDEVVAVAGVGVPRDLIGRRFGIEQGMLAHVFASKQAVVIEDYRSLIRPVEHPAAKNVRAGCSAPIFVGAEVRGALSAGSTDPARRFGKRERELLGEVAALGSLALEHAQMREQLAQTLRSGVQALAAAVDIRDRYTAEHSGQVARLTCAVGKRLGLDEAAIIETEFAALLHDVGKIGVPDSILHKPGQLSAEDWKIMKLHPALGAEVLARIPGLERVADIVRAEHERWDGGGYPNGLRAEQIPQGSRIILACDAYHAMISDRPYRKALSKRTAIKELKANAGTQFCPTTIRALLATLTTHPPSPHATRRHPNTRQTTQPATHRTATRPTATTQRP